MWFTIGYVCSVGYMGHSVVIVYMSHVIPYDATSASSDRMAGTGGIYVTFVVYNSPRHIVVSVRPSGPLSKVTLRALSRQLMNIKREALRATSGPLVFLGHSWW